MRAFNFDADENAKLFRRYDPEIRTAQEQYEQSGWGSEQQIDIVPQQIQSKNIVTQNENSINNRQDLVQIYLPKLRLAKISGFESISKIQRQLSMEREEFLNSPDLNMRDVPSIMREEFRFEAHFKSEIEERYRA